MSGLYRFDDLWIGLAEGPAFDDYTSGSGQYAEQALRRLSDRLRDGLRAAAGIGADDELSDDDLAAVDERATRAVAAGLEDGSSR